HAHTHTRTHWSVTFIKSPLQRIMITIYNGSTSSTMAFTGAQILHYKLCLSQCTHTRTHTHTHAHTHTHTHTHTDKLSHTQTAHTKTHTHPHKNTHAHTHTPKHTHTHTHFEP